MATNGRDASTEMDCSHHVATYFDISRSRRGGVRDFRCPKRRMEISGMILFFGSHLSVINIGICISD